MQQMDLYIAASSSLVSLDSIFLAKKEKGCPSPLTFIPMLIGFCKQSLLYSRKWTLRKCPLKVRKKRKQINNYLWKQSVQKLLSEVEQLNYILKNTLEPKRICWNSWKKIIEIWTRLQIFLKPYTDNSGFKLSINAWRFGKEWFQALDDEKEEFIQSLLWRSSWSKKTRLNSWNILIVLVQTQRI